MAALLAGIFFTVCIMQSFGPMQFSTVVTIKGVLFVYLFLIIFNNINELVSGN